MQPTLTLKNQYGEQSSNAVIGGSGFVDISLIVDSANGNGLGLRSAKGLGQYVTAAYMFTSASPAVGNPNPAAGLIYLKLASGLQGYNGGYPGQIPPLAGSPLTSTTSGAAYVITSLGTTTADQWLAAGLPAGATAAVGMPFTAIATGAIGGTGTVEVPGVPSVLQFCAVGDANQSSKAGYLILQSLAPTSSSVTTLVATAPADGTVIAFRLVLDGTIKES